MIYKIQRKEHQFCRGTIMRMKSKFKPLITLSTLGKFCWHRPLDNCKISQKNKLRKTFFKYVV